ncbi:MULTISPECIES: nuclear transport factor 2 family protein [Aquitalea]|uniref:nuclear transport factor 2 family protein n=1 Tax=Aquitalea TaxID=407217 RepID=UPI0007883C63|nr:MULTISPECIES: nuclear transport factor 2 family protein [Aquitalea]
MSCSSDIEQIRQALTAYYHALYYGRPEKLEEAFRPDAILLGDVDGNESRLDQTQYRNLLQTRVSPHAQGEPYGLQIGEIRLCGNAAMAELQTPLAGKVFTDYVSLFKRQGRWRIAFKLYSHPQ